VQATGLTLPSEVLAELAKIGGDTGQHGAVD